MSSQEKTEFRASTRPQIERHESRPAHFRLRFSASADTPGLIHTLCWKLFHHLQADIHGLASNTTRSGPVMLARVSLPQDLDGGAARRIVEERF
ncbi:hypothetical protein [Haloferula sp. A504]|uniref:hypothetical protein n=1 Tax=Haloferula sp. A504 TaxID=3373601 RepID=UPI0031CACABF|nr:hypothetical protein [Verrucomicrobiaceae bacterium E54]